ncbi:MAG: permease [Ruminococcaceae bacterium]|nr:permease [Oscillospiraceae bacterium]
MDAKAREQGYETLVVNTSFPTFGLDDGETVTVNAVGSVTATKEKNTLTLLYFGSKDDAKSVYDFYKGTLSDATVLERSGKIVYFGTDAARGELIRPAFFNSFKGILKVSGVSFLVYTVFVIAALGYLLGRVTVKGVNLGTAGVFLVALLFGCIFYRDLAFQLPAYTTNALKVVENLGLILFVTSVGFIAGPKFFGNLKKNFKTYIVLGLLIIVSGAAVCAVCVLVQSNFTDLPKGDLAAIMAGLFSGALTSTPAFSAAKAAATAQGIDESLVAVGNGIAYIFGVIGVVLFVQLIPKFLKVNMAEERAKIAGGDADTGEEPVEVKETKKLIEIDPFGIAAFALAAIVGVIVGSFKFGNFSLTTTGGCLLVALVFGHFGNFGPVKVMPNAPTLKVFREFGLMLFLIGAGIAGGAKFVEYFEAIYFLYGAIMTLVPMIIGFFFAKYVLKMHLLNSLGSITGGMTSTPALGTLIQVSETEDVGSAYAATYPIALISVVLCAQFVIILFG